MPVNLGKYSADIVFCARKHLHSAQNYFAPRKYTYISAQIFIQLRRNS